MSQEDHGSLGPVLASWTAARLLAGPALALTSIVSPVPVAATAAPAAGVSPAALQRAQSTGVYVEGDSLTVGAADPLRRRLRHQVRDVGIDAEIGRFTATGMSRLAGDARAHRSRLWVVALGTNDSPDPARIRGFVRQSLRLAGPSRQVVWLTLVRPGGYGAVNTMLRRLDRRHDRLHVVDWARTVERTPGLIGADGVHATSHGYAVRGAMIAGTVVSLARTT